MEILSIIDLGIQLKGKKEQGRLSSSFHPSQRTDIASNSLITCLPLYNNAQGREQESGAINLPTLLQINSFLHSHQRSFFPSFAFRMSTQPTDTSVFLYLWTFIIAVIDIGTFPSPFIREIYRRISRSPVSYAYRRLHLRPILLRFPRRTRACNSFSRGDRVLAFIAACIAVNLSPDSEAAALENEESSRHKSSRGHSARCRRLCRPCRWKWIKYGVSRRPTPMSYIER